MPSEAKLKPCPFCKEAEKLDPRTIDYKNGKYAGLVYCGECDTEGPTYFSKEGESEEEAREGGIDLWNTRASRATPDIDKAAEEIRNLLWVQDDGRERELGVPTEKTVALRAILTNLAPAESDTVKVLEMLNEIKGALPFPPHHLAYQKAAKKLDKAIKTAGGK